MNILHYSLGLPIYRTGGLTKYSFDLMKEQVKQNQDVYLLFPGVMRFISQKNIIRKYKNYKGIHVYELINPLPVPLLNGIINPNEYMKMCDRNIYINFIKKLNIDIVHIHTFMGIHKELLEACKELNVKVVYTTHDYFGLCTKVNFVDKSGKLCEDRNIDKCIKCNLTGNSLNKIKILQSKTYRFVRNNIDIGKLKKVSSIIKSLKSSNKNLELSVISEAKSFNKKQYQQLSDYYKNMFQYIDKFLFNSSIAKKIYNKYIKAEGDIIPITHGDIHDNRIKKDFNSNELRLTYLGANKDYKGFNLLCDVMKDLIKDGYDKIKLNTYGDEAEIYQLPLNINVNGKYKYSDLKNIFDKTDVLLVPSICNETFGFITLESLSYGVPVLLSDRVGSKDLISRDKYKKGMIIKADLNSFKDKIKAIYNNRSILKKFNCNILSDNFNYELKDHCNKINTIYTKLI